MRVGDVTAEVPRRRMAVVRGTLWATVEESDLKAAPAACLNAVKRASEVLPELAPFQLTHCECDLVRHDDRVEATVTVQAYGRVALSTAALLGCSAALGAAVERRLIRDGVRLEIEVVQDVVE